VYEIEVKSREEVEALNYRGSAELATVDGVWLNNRKN
jgi:hypothetical protein